ncbi:MAG TPA: GAF domain-containing protein [Firmicutes bacterium]|nr:GAF domain-containing protein [Bacillota bacterium]
MGKESLCEVCESINSALRLEDALDIIVRNAGERLKLKASSIRLLDPRRETLQISAAYGLSEVYISKGPVKPEKSILDREALSGKLVYVEDAAQDPRIQYPEDVKKEGIRSILCVPIMLEGRPIGVLRAYAGDVRHFTDSEIETLRILANQGAIAIRNARLYRRMQTLSELARRIGSTLELSDVLNLLVEGAAKAMGGKAASLRLLDRFGERLTISAAYGLTDEYIAKGPVEVHKSVLDYEAVLEKKPVTIYDATLDPKFQYRQEAEREGIRSVLCVPLIAREKVLGVLRVYTGVPYEFTQDEIDFLAALANLGALAIENARMHKQMKESYERLMADVSSWHDWDSWGTR